MFGAKIQSWFTKLIDNKINAFTKDPGSVHYYYGQWQSSFNEMKKSGVKFYEGLPTSTEEIPSDSLIVLDDLQQLAVKSDVVANLFTRGIHHNKFSNHLFSKSFSTRTKKSSHLFEFSLFGFVKIS